MSRSPRTNQEILRVLRFSQEYWHRFWQEHFFGLSPGPGLLTLPLCSPIPQVYLEHIQDSCNKSTAIYIITPPLEPRPMAYCNDSAERTDSIMAYSNDNSNRTDMIFSIYESWFRDHNVDIDFGNFPAQLIRVEFPFVAQRPGIANIIRKHKAWCEHVESNLQLCASKTDLTQTEIDHPWLEFNGCMGINRKQNVQYKLRPLSRALIMIVDHPASPGKEKIVHLVRTNIPVELSAPISFDSITPKLESDRSSDYRGVNVATTTLSAAMDFIATLESREAKAFPEDRRDMSIIDEGGEDPGYHTREARSMGYTGPDLRMSSSRWVKLTEAEHVRPPCTPLVLRMRLRPEIMDSAFLARYPPREVVKKEH